MAAPDRLARGQGHKQKLLSRESPGCGDDWILNCASYAVACGQLLPSFGPVPHAQDGPTRTLSASIAVQEP
jgi:hypothetical protein